MQLKLRTLSFAVGFLALALPGHASAQKTTRIEVNAAQAERGRGVFAMRGCDSCHSIGEGKKVGPDLANVTVRRERDWLVKWLRDPGDVIDSGDPIAKKLQKQFKDLRMPTLRLSDEEIDALINYLASTSQADK